MSELIKGVYADIPFKEYSAIQAVSNSYLSKLNQCPAAALVVTPDTPSLAFGRALHCYVLEGQETFDKRYLVTPRCDKRTKEGKALYEQFQSELNGREAVSADDAATIRYMSPSILSHPFAKQLLEQGLSEQTVIWQDEETGLWCKCRPDRIPSNASGVFLDLKTTGCANERAFQSSVISYGYYRQAAMYMEGLSHATGIIYRHFAFIACEKEPPFRVEVYTLDDQFLQDGYDDFHRLLLKEKKCRDSGFYPNYENGGAVELYAPQYTRKVE
jgi:hypothetical protein